MKINLAIVNYDVKSADIYIDQINSIFSGDLKLKKYCLNEGKINNIKEDFILVQNSQLFEKVKDSISKDAEIMFCNRTVSKDGMDKILGIKKGSEVVVLDETLEMSRNIISIIYEFGTKSLKLLPASPQCKDIFKNKIVIILGESSYIPKDAKEIINIGSSLIDISTIIAIAFKLNLKQLISNKDIQKSYSEIIPSSLGITEIIGETNRMEGILKVLFDAMEDGLMTIDPNGEILAVNDAGKKILAIKGKVQPIGNGIMLFPDIPFKQAIDSLRPIKDKLIKINGYDVIVSVNPIIHSNKFYGAVAIIKSFSDTELKQHKFRTKLIGKGHTAKYDFSNIIGNSLEITRCREKATRMANSNSTILITGETGTGKELFAQAIHNNSVRKNYQFVVINCGALPESLLESELFGYEEGSFTGARKGGKPGLFELAHMGTLFLDEIGEMPLSLQSRLLRIIQERQVMRLGGDRLIDIDVRLIAATNRNITTMVDKGQFRQDLFYRLNVLSLKIPSLNSRKEDIPDIIQGFKRDFIGSFILTKEAQEALMAHNWKGNVRELRNNIEYLVNLGISEVNKEDLPFYQEEPYLQTNINMDNFYKTASKNIDSYIFVLETLKEAFDKNLRLGRRSIFKATKEHNLFISEQEIRHILSKLEDLGMVKILKGRSGTIITKEGIQTLKNYR